ncbi:MAG: hypothetical protein HYT70_00645 [Candidatus Aenigmarchaeota archaeon]|nr:hypothetical protein [Candidatus Aenigmarchaeota archaeon]
MATDVFRIAVEQLLALGFYEFVLPFILFSTVLYAMLRKTQILGDSIVIHAIVSMGVGLFIFALPVIIGVGIVPALTRFFAQMSILMIVLVFSFLVASFFYPNIVERLPEIVKTSGPLQFIIYMIIGVAGFLGLFSVSSDYLNYLIRISGVNFELVAMSGVVLVSLVVFLLVAMAMSKEVS